MALQSWELSPVIDEILPPDVPDDHPAMKKVTFSGSKGTWNIRVQVGGEMIAAQTTVAALNSQHLAGRIARAMYVKLVEQGQSKQSVLDWRKAVYEEIKEKLGSEMGKTSAPRKAEAKPRGAGEEGATVKKEEGAASSSAPIKVKKEEEKDDKKVAVKQEPDPALVEAVRILEEDAPSGHRGDEARKRVVYVETEGLWRIDFKLQDGSFLTIKADQVGGSLAHAGRIARLCILSLFKGGSEDEVRTYMGELCEKAVHALQVTAKSGYVDGVPPKGEGKAKKRRHKEMTGVKKEKDPRPEKKARNQEDPQEASDAWIKEAETLGAAGKLRGSVRVFGGSKGKNLKSIRGLYLVVPGGHDGSPAFKHSRQSRFLHLSKKKRWSITKSLGDESRGMAYRKVNSPTEPPYGPGSWFLLSDKPRGHVEDLDFSCRPVSELLATVNPKLASEAAWTGDWHATGPSSGSKTEKESAAAPVSKVKDEPGAETAGESDSDSDESSSESSSSDEVEVKEESKRAVSTPPPVPKDTKVRSASEAHGQPPTPMKHYAPRVCAKMLVRAGVRCLCHFLPTKQCPSKKR